MTVMDENFYQLDLAQRRRMLADAGFVRDQTRIWAHPDGRAVGEGVAIALTDAAFCRFLRVALPAEIAAAQVELAQA
jgi:hypothetical protein